MKQSVTLFFPGQGSQYVGMGKDINEAKDLFDKADKILGISLSKLCLEGPEEDLKLTENTQPAILTHSVAMFLKLKKYLDNKNIKIDRVLGHSVGEYAALVAAGALRFEDGVKAVNLRGKYMQEAVPAGVGKMIAIMKVPQEHIEKACREVSTSESIVSPANFNGQDQIVISGHAEACDRAVKWLEDNTDIRVRAIPLKVSAPFHCELMRPAATNLKKHLDTVEFKNLEIPYVANIDAKEYQVDTLPETIKTNLINQVCGTVQWTKSILALPSNTIALEVGPGNIIAGMVKKINPEIKILSLDKEGAFDEIEGLFAL